MKKCFKEKLERVMTVIGLVVIAFASVALVQLVLKLLLHK